MNESICIRTIHHLSGTGGTLISKCIACMENVYLISEVSPQALAGKIKFNPLDPLQQAIAQYDGELSFDETARSAAFLQRLAPVIMQIEKKNGILVLRDHSHTDWLRDQPRMSSTLLETLRAEYNVRPLVTMRNPVESYATMAEHGWNIRVGSFDEYCKRVLLFLDYFRGVDLFHYEDFVSQPDRVLRDLTNALLIPFDADWSNKFFTVQLTGDSGRGGVLKTVHPMAMRAVSDEYRKEILASDAYAKLCDRFDYQRDPEEMRLERERLVQQY
jgi:hypothetical protein